MEPFNELDYVGSGTMQALESDFHLKQLTVKGWLVLLITECGKMTQGNTKVHVSSGMDLAHLVEKPA